MFFCCRNWLQRKVIQSKLGLVNMTGYIETRGIWHFEGMGYCRLGTRRPEMTAMLLMGTGAAQPEV